MAGILRVRDLHKGFGGLLAVNGCAFEVEEGSVTGLIGPNGAGKTTLFNLISGFLRPDAGEIWLDGRRIDGLPPHQIARAGLVRTFQIPRELPLMTVLENLLVVPREQPGEGLWSAWLRPAAVWRHERELVDRALKILAFVELLPLRDELARTLSVGQKKLLELARALMAEPRVLLLDEPGAGVNPTLLRKLAGMIRQLRDEGKTFVLIEHDMGLVMDLCDRVVVMHNGERLTEGSPREVRSDPRVVEAYLGAVGAGA